MVAREPRGVTLRCRCRSRPRCGASHPDVRGLPRSRQRGSSRNPRAEVQFRRRVGCGTAQTRLEPSCPGCPRRPRRFPSPSRWAATLLHPSRPDDDRCRTWPVPEVLDLRSPGACAAPRRRSRPPRTGPVPFLPRNCSWTAPRRGIENGPRTALALVSPGRDEPHHVAQAHQATTRAWGAACFERVLSHASWVEVSVSQRRTTSSRSRSRTPWAA